MEMIIDLQIARTPSYQILCINYRYDFDAPTLSYLKIWDGVENPKNN
jgi:hypothetical protein